jgi:hypothetical protein
MKTKWSASLRRAANDGRNAEYRPSRRTRLLLPVLRTLERERASEAVLPEKSRTAALGLLRQVTGEVDPRRAPAAPRPPARPCLWSSRRLDERGRNSYGAADFAKRFRVLGVAGQGEWRPQKLLISEGIETGGGIGSGRHLRRKAFRRCPTLICGESLPAACASVCPMTHYQRPSPVGARDSPDFRPASRAVLQAPGRLRCCFHSIETELPFPHLCIFSRVRNRSPHLRLRKSDKDPRPG